MRPFKFFSREVFCEIGALQDESLFGFLVNIAFARTSSCHLSGTMIHRNFCWRSGPFEAELRGLDPICKHVQTPSLSLQGTSKKPSQFSNERQDPHHAQNRPRLHARWQNFAVRQAVLKVSGMLVEAFRKSFLTLRLIAVLLLDRPRLCFTSLVDRHVQVHVCIPCPLERI